ncbi:hypothetical protein PHSC3_001953 [Chlamydiales bacterium STE3]|nr:hypothetical protein PHSC3_001953 [Chlamydiales bacterium STE3]
MTFLKWRFIGKIIVFLCLVSLLPGCGYRLGLGNSILRGKTLSIPYIEGDLDGSLTEAVINAVSSCLDVAYTNGNGEIILKIAIIDGYEKHIGFRYDRKRSGKIKKSIIPIETRATLIACLELFDFNGCKLMGPVNIKASVDFDHDYYSSHNGVNLFSLGQLSDIDSAEDAVRKPLHRALAEKIADFLNNAW